MAHNTAGGISHGCAHTGCLQQPPLRASVRREHACMQKHSDGTLCAHAHGGGRGEGSTVVRQIQGRKRSNGRRVRRCAVRARAVRVPCSARAVRHKFGVAVRCRCTLTSEMHACRSVRLYTACGVPHPRTMVLPPIPPWRRHRTCLLGWRGRARRAHDERRGRGDLGCRRRLCAGARREQRRQARNLIQKGDIPLGQLVEPSLPPRNSVRPIRRRSAPLARAYR